MTTEVNFMIGGEAGQGVQSVGFLVAKMFSRGGYYVFADQDYESRIRGGHNFFRIRVRDKPVNSLVEKVDVLVALNRESVDLHRGEMTPSGVILFDAEKAKESPEGDNIFKIPMEAIARDTAGNPIMANTVGLGAAMALVDYDTAKITEALRQHFGKGQIGDQNVRAAEAGCEYVKQHFKKPIAVRMRPIGSTSGMMLSGTDAIALGAIAAGCKYVSGYPMTPTTPILEYFAAKQGTMDTVMVQLEDEIACINSVIGAAYAGVRAMTATSGGGFSLMVEALSLAGMTETPIVVVLGMRPGPAIGLPTRTEQAELEFAIHAGHGEFPRAVLAPATIEDCFWQTVQAFNLAEKYQSPIILVVDHFMSTAYYITDRFDLSKVTIERGDLYAPATGDAAGYKRHKITPSGISPRAFPLQQEGLLVVTDSDEHNEEGHIIEDAGTRAAMVRKRMKKMEGLLSEVTAPRVYGPESAEISLVGWGSSYAAMCEAVDQLEEDGMTANVVHLNQLWPFPAAEVNDALSGARLTYCVESNATGQLAHLLRAETGRNVDGKILRYDGRPLTAAYIEHAVRRGGQL